MHDNAAARFLARAPSPSSASDGEIKEHLSLHPKSGGIGTSTSGAHSIMAAAIGLTSLGAPSFSGHSTVTKNKSTTAPCQSVNVDDGAVAVVVAAPKQSESVRGRKKHKTAKRIPPKKRKKQMTAAAAMARSQLPKLSRQGDCSSAKAKSKDASPMPLSQEIEVIEQKKAKQLSHFDAASRRPPSSLWRETSPPPEKKCLTSSYGEQSEPVRRQSPQESSGPEPKTKSDRPLNQAPPSAIVHSSQQLVHQEPNKSQRKRNFQSGEILRQTQPSRSSRQDSCNSERQQALGSGPGPTLHLHSPHDFPAVPLACHTILNRPNQYTRAADRILRMHRKLNQQQIQQQRRLEQHQKLHPPRGGVSGPISQRELLSETSIPDYSKDCLSAPPASRDAAQASTATHHRHHNNSAFTCMAVSHSQHHHLNIISPSVTKQRQGLKAIQQQILSEMSKPNIIKVPSLGSISTIYSLRSAGTERTNDGENIEGGRTNGDRRNGAAADREHKVECGGSRLPLTEKASPRGNSRSFLSIHRIMTRKIRASRRMHAEIMEMAASGLQLRVDNAGGLANLKLSQRVPCRQLVQAPLPPMRMQQRQLPASLLSFKTRFPAAKMQSHQLQVQSRMPRGTQRLMSHDMMFRELEVEEKVQKEMALAESVAAITRYRQFH
mmetsp:Transcript_10406/g.22618  ORF Transcript_10406/g.22618 Transcript_10406/m.22618 type:complete len:662 (+) Transcript_10406:113-2098(+)